MGLYLMAASVWFEPEWYWQLLQVAIGLGAVIFVHELGHFAVAKMCGVKCEKFYIGFDIGGWKFCKFQWGETEYGIGVLPLGGYVKMLGQEDNPSRVAEELEKAKVQHVRNEASAEPGFTLDPRSSQSIIGPPRAVEPAEPVFTLDPRSYLAQSVPERMAIISAGVIMNVIFAWIFASVAYKLGVQYSPCVVAGLYPGDAAWQAGLRVGDEITQINDVVKPRFQDLSNEVAFGDVNQGVPLKVKRAGVNEELSIIVYPERKEGSLAPRIGILAARTNRIVASQKVPTALPGTSASRAKPGFEHGDEIVAVNGEPVANYAQLHAQLALHPQDQLTFTVKRTGPASSEKSKEPAPTTTHQVVVEPEPVRQLGLEMKMGAIVAVQPGSPAAQAGLKMGDTLQTIDGQPLGDPITFAERLRRKAGDAVKLTLLRAGEPAPITVDATLRKPDWFESHDAEGVPMSAPALGIAYQVQNEVAAVTPGSPAEKGGLKPGDQVTAVKVTQPESDLELFVNWSLPKAIDKLSWPAVAGRLQEIAPGAKVELTLQDGRKVTLEPAPSSEWFDPERGLVLQGHAEIRTAESAAEAMSLGLRETGDSLFMVVRFLQKLGSGGISPMAVGGIGSIFSAATNSASIGLAQLLIFLCMLSANLAIINMLPIPVLDGGHMVFLAYEGLFRKPFPEKWFLIFTWAGLMFVLGLLLFANGLDVWRIFS